MEYRLKISEETFDLNIETDGEDRFTVTRDEKTIPVRFQRIDEHRIHLSVDGRQSVAFVADTAEGKTVLVEGSAWLVEDMDAQPRQGRRRGGLQNGPSEVTPPMPAVVTRILVAEGDTVVKGQGVVVVSAMKMETTLPAPFDGRVTRINVAEGDKVAPKQVLVDIEAAEGE